MALLSNKELLGSIKEKYSAIAKSQLDQSSDSAIVNKVAEAFGYSSLDLDSLPGGANMGLSCGNPVGVASLKEVSIRCIIISTTLKLESVGRDGSRSRLWRRP